MESKIPEKWAEEHADRAMRPKSGIDFGVWSDRRASFIAGYQAAEEQYRTTVSALTRRIEELKAELNETA